MPNPNCLIYGLVDPRTNVIRYVGKTTKGIERAQFHRWEGKAKGTHKARWIASLEREGLDYGVVILQPVAIEAALDDAERFWIRLLRNRLGELLTNATEGGEGGKLSAEARARSVAGIRRAAAEGRMGFKKRHSERTKQLLSKLNKERMSNGDHPFLDPIRQAQISRDYWSRPEAREAARIRLAARGDSMAKLGAAARWGKAGQ